MNPTFEILSKATLALVLFVGCLSSLRVVTAAQREDAAQNLRFEVASVKPSFSDPPPTGGFFLDVDHDTLRMSEMSGEV